MGTLYVFVIFVTLSTHCSANAVSNSETYRSIASVLLKEGQSAKISCMTKGTGDYFWRKGNFLHNSTLVASFTVGEVTDDSQPYSVTVNGTLHIRSVTLKDEGNYFCRVSSTENECYGEVKILVQASLFNFNLAIDRCERESSCLLYLDPSQSTSVTCTALNAPPLMTLKWFNGSKEITEGIVQNELLPQNGNSREITSTVASVYGRPASLTCQAVDPKRGNDDVRFAHAQVEMTVPAHDTLPSWIIVSVTLAGCFIVFGIYLLIKAKVNRKQHKKYTKLKREDVEALTKKVNTNEETINAKHQELTEFKVSAESKDSELSKLKDELRKTKEELNKSKLENSKLQKKNANNEAKITAAKESAETKDQEIKDKNQELTNLKSKVPDQIQEMSTLKGDVQSKAKAIAELEVGVRSKAKAIAELENKLKQRDEEIQKAKNENLELQTKIANNEAKLTAAKESAKTKDQEIKNKNQEIADLISKVPDQIQEMSTLKGNLASKANSITELQTKLKRRDEENLELQQRVANYDAKITAAEELGKTKDQEIKNKNQELTDLKSKVTDQIQEMSTLKGDVQSKAKSIADLEDTLRRKEEDIKRVKNENVNLQMNLQKEKTDIERKNDKISELEGNLTQKDDALREITIKLEKSKAIVKDKSVELLNTSKELADLKGTQQRSQNKPRKKHQGNDGD